MTPRFWRGQSRGQVKPGCATPEGSSPGRAAPSVGERATRMLDWLSLPGEDRTEHWQAWLR